MYSHEIEELLKVKQYLLAAKEYINICWTSPQIREMKYNKDTDLFEMWTDDNYYFQFRVHPDKELEQEKPKTL